MKLKRFASLMLILTIILSALILNGCTYMKARGRDAMDIVDLGVELRLNT